MGARPVGGSQPGTRQHRAFELGQFTLSQFGVQTIHGPELFQGEDGEAPATSPYAFETLGDDETVARLATGIKRFKLPDEFNPIKIFQEIVETPATGKAEEAVGMLASIFANRRQYVRAAEYLTMAKDEVRRPRTRRTRTSSTRSSARGAQFGTLATQPAGRGATVDFTFRNGRLVHFEAHHILFDKLLNDVKAYLGSRPPQLDWQKIDISDIGARLVAQNQQQYLGESVAQWDLDLDPLPEPLRQADHRLHAAAEGGRLPADRPGRRGEHQPDRGLARRHGAGPQAAGEAVVLLSWPTRGRASRSPAQM